MSVEYRDGDLFKSGFTALAHGVNCRGLMGAGIAREFRRKWPGMFNEYSYLCRKDRLKPGMIHAWRSDGGMVVYNLATQDQPGRHATLGAVRESVKAMTDHAGFHGIAEIGMPRIGAGIGGLRWPDVADVVEDVAVSATVRLVVVSLPDEANL